MDTNETKFDQAEQCLSTVQAELNRHAEDVATIVVYKNVQKSITHYLMGFLLTNNVTFDEEETLDVLLKKCKTTDSEFNNFDLSTIIFTKDYKYSANLIRWKTVLN